MKLAPVLPSTHVYDVPPDAVIVTVCPVEIVNEGVAATASVG